MRSMAAFCATMRFTAGVYGVCAESPVIFLRMATKSK